MSIEPPPRVTAAEIAAWLGRGSHPRANRLAAAGRRGRRWLRRWNFLQILGSAGCRCVGGGFLAFAATVLLLAGLATAVRHNLGAGACCGTVALFMLASVYDWMTNPLPERMLPDVYADAAGLHLDSPQAPAIPWYQLTAVRFEAGRQIVNLDGREVVVPADTPNAVGLSHCLDQLLAARAAGRLLPGEPDPREASIPTTALSRARGADDDGAAELGLSVAQE